VILDDLDDTCAMVSFERLRGRMPATDLSNMQA
jgi:hypothetical protein